MKVYNIRIIYRNYHSAIVISTDLNKLKEMCDPRQNCTRELEQQCTGYLAPTALLVLFVIATITFILVMGFIIYWYVHNLMLICARVLLYVLLCSLKRKGIFEIFQEAN